MFSCNSSFIIVNTKPDSVENFNGMYLFTKMDSSVIPKLISHLSQTRLNCACILHPSFVCLRLTSLNNILFNQTVTST